MCIRDSHGWICYFAAFYQLTTGNQEGCLHYLDESVRCLLGTDLEHHVARVYNMIGIVAHMQNNLSLAMEQYDKALDYTEKYDDKMVHSIVLSLSLIHIYPGYHQRKSPYQLRYGAAGDLVTFRHYP